MSARIFVYPCACASVVRVAVCACVPAYAHVFTLCPYACNRRQLLLCFCTPVGQFVRLYACVNELLTTMCLYAWLVVLLDMCMPMCTFFYVLLCVSINLRICCICSFCFLNFEFVRLSACAPVASCICQCLLSVVCVVLVAGWNDYVD